MMATKHNAFLDISASDESDNEEGYDSEAAEQSKGGRSSKTSERASKRRKLSPAESESEDDVQNEDEASATATAPPRTSLPRSAPGHKVKKSASAHVKNDSTAPTSTSTTTPLPTEPTATTQTTKSPRPESKSKSKPLTPGVIYLSSLPPYLRPSALRNLLTQRGFAPITRLFLTPASKSKSKSSSKRQLYTEGWVEFASRRTARLCASTLNASPIGGPKGGWYHDDNLNIRYLRGMGWEELMAGVREERREEDGRRDEERLVLARETKRFVEGVERGKKAKTTRERDERRKKGEGKGGGEGAVAQEENARHVEDVKRTWRQFEVKGKKRERDVEGADAGDEAVGEDVRRVLGKIF